MHLFRVGVLALALSSIPAQAIEPFVIKDIRVEGIQRTEAGTVFSYLPVKVGDTMTDEKASQTIRALFATGFFRDVTIEAEDSVLVVLVQERPSIARPASRSPTAARSRLNCSRRLRFGESEDLNYGPDFNIRTQVFHSIV